MLSWVDASPNPGVDDRPVISDIIHGLKVACRWQDGPAALRQPSTIGFIVGRCADGGIVSAQELILPRTDQQWKFIQQQLK